MADQNRPRVIDWALIRAEDRQRNGGRPYAIAVDEDGRIGVNTADDRGHFDDRYVVASDEAWNRTYFAGDDLVLTPREPGNGVEPLMIPPDVIRMADEYLQEPSTFMMIGETVLLRDEMSYGTIEDIHGERESFEISVWNRLDGRKSVRETIDYFYSTDITLCHTRDGNENLPIHMSELSRSMADLNNDDPVLLHARNRLQHAFDATPEETGGFGKLKFIGYEARVVMADLEQHKQTQQSHEKESGPMANNDDEWAARAAAESKINRAAERSYQAIFGDEDPMKPDVDADDVMADANARYEAHLRSDDYNPRSEDRMLEVEDATTVRVGRHQKQRIGFDSSGARIGIVLMDLGRPTLEERFDPRYETRPFSDFEHFAHFARGDEHLTFTATDDKANAFLDVAGAREGAVYLGVINEHMFELLRNADEQLQPRSVDRAPEPQPIPQDQQLVQRDIDDLRHTIDQWNPYNEKMQSKIRKYTQIADSADDRLNSGRDMSAEQAAGLHETLDRTLQNLGARQKPATDYSKFVSGQENDEPVRQHDAGPELG